MKSTTDQILQQGISAHREGKLQEAERLYRAVLQLQPDHGDANHNLGVLMVTAGKAEESLPLLVSAIEANPSVTLYWLTFAECLIHANELVRAEKVLFDLRKSGVSAEELALLENKLETAGRKKDFTKKESISSSKIDSESGFENGSKHLVTERDGAPQELLTELLDRYAAGNFVQAEALAVSLTSTFPEAQFPWKILGAIQEETGRVAESLLSNRTSVQLSPLDPEAHNNLGNSLEKVGMLDAAEESYRRAIAIDAQYANAQYNLGNTLKALGKMHEAESSYRQALKLQPSLDVGHLALGKLLLELGRHHEGLRERRLGGGIISFDQRKGLSIQQK